MKGALETLFDRSFLGEDERARLEALADDWARRGLRVLAVAERLLPESAPLDEAADSELSVLGLAALQDPLRPAAADAVRTARSAGIGVSMLTGDHPLTAATIGAQIGLGSGSPLTGSDLESMDDAALERASAGHVGSAVGRGDAGAQLNPML